MRISFGIVMVGLLYGSAAMADHNADAKRLYASGNQHFALAEYDQAIADFKEAFRHKEDPVFLYNIAQCYRQLPGQEDSAIRFYRTYLARTAQTPNREEIERWIAELEQRRGGQPQPQQQQPAQPPPPVVEAPRPMVETPPPVAAPPVLQWMPGANGSIPQGAYAAGRENGRGLAICQASYQGGMHPGKVVGKNCNFGYGGAEVTVPTYNVLVADARGLAWVPSNAGASNLVQGGNEANGTPLLLCRASYQGGVHPGKLVGNQCAFGWGGKEMNAPQYELLALASAPVAAPAPAGFKRDVEAGPLWNNDNAKGTCPTVCGRAGGTWGGGWRTTVPGKMSVCACTFAR